VVLLVEVVVVLLEISLCAFVLPVCEAKDHGKADENHDLKPGEFALHSVAPSYSDLDCFWGGVAETRFEICGITKSRMSRSSSLHPTAQEEQ